MVSCIGFQLFRLPSVNMGLPRSTDGQTCTKTRRPRCPRTLKVGSDFSGLDAGAVALKRLGVEHTVQFTCDTLKASYTIMNKVHAPVKIFTDIMSRTKEDEEPVDVYFWTPPCQDVSSSGKRTGLQGPRQTGKLIKKSMSYIKVNRPRLTIFENVPAIMNAKFKYIPIGIKKALESIGYEVHTSILNSRDYGSPQDRRRVFIVGFKEDALKHKFHWPKITQAPSINSILDPWKPTDKACRLPGWENGQARCKDAFKTCYNNGRDPSSTPIMVDVDASKRFSSFGVDEAKTLTRSRGGSGGPWVSTRGRRMTINELVKLQGFQKSDIMWEELKISERTVGQMLGNAVNVNTMACILEEALWSAGLVMKKVTFPR